MRAAIAVCLLLVAGCTSPPPPGPGSNTPSRPELASGGVVEYPVPNPMTPGSSCFGCGQASLGGIAAGVDGNIWFTNGGQYKVGRMTLSGVITQFDLPAIVGGPGSIASGPDGNIWVTTNALGQGRQDWILRIGRDGAVTQFPAGAGSGDTSTGPQSITTGPDGNLWFTEFWTNRIGRMTPMGVLTEFPIPTADSAPRGIVAGPDGSLWFVESHFSHTGVARITTAGAVTEYSLGGSSLDQLQPTDVVAGRDGNLWLNQTHPSAPQGEIVRVARDGSLKVFAMPKGTRPGGMASGPDGNIWFTDWSANTIGRMSPSGALRQFPLPRRQAQPVAIVAGPGGRMWFTENSRIASIGYTVPEANFSSRVLTFPAGPATTREVLVSNTGDADLTIVSSKVVGSDQPMFSVTHDGCAGHHLAAQGSCRIDVAFKPDSTSGVRGARLAITDNATASPQSVSLVAQLPNCKLPVFTSTASNAQGGFLSLSDGAVNADPRGGFVTEGTLSHSQASPVLFGQLPATYFGSAGRWVPTSDRAILPGISRYAYIYYPQPFQGLLHVVDVASGADRTLPLPNGPNGPYGLIGWTSDGIYLHASYEGVGPGLWLANPETGATSQIFSDSIVDLVSGHVAWTVTRNESDPAPDPGGIGPSHNDVQSRDLTTQQTTTWLYRSGSDLNVIGTNGISIVVSGRERGSAALFMVSNPGDFVPIYVPETSDPLPLSQGLIGDDHGWWFGSLDGIYFWSAHTGAILVSTFLAAPAGACA